MKNKLNKKTTISLFCFLIMALAPFTSFAANTGLSIFKIEIDWVPLKKNNEGPIKDFYMNAGEDDGIQMSMVLNVYRKKVVTDANTSNSFEINIPVGKVKVIKLFKNVAVTRIIALTSYEDEPLLKYRTVLVGDNLVPEMTQSTAIIKKAPKAATQKVKKQAPNISLASELLFEFDRWNLKAEAKEALGKVYDMFNKSKEQNILITGYTCSQGLEEHNLELSRKRAQSVSDYLVKEKGIGAEKIQIEYFGSKYPVASNNTEEGRIKNRRVEISFLTAS